MCLWMCSHFHDWTDKLMGSHIFGILSLRKVSFLEFEKKNGKFILGGLTDRYKADA